jgi:LAS superfamily LD-carboxypeptidase LdcB
VLVVTLVIVVVVVIGAFGSHSLASSPSTAAAPISARPGPLPRALGPADGAIPDATTVFDDDVPGVANLDPSLSTALRRAAARAADDGITFFVESGWRSPAYQEHLLDEAIAKYGSREEAARWVATPTTSAHVRGAAIDIAPSEAATWLSRHGARSGLCRVYGNEPWHFELRPVAVEHGCPPMYADPTDDPRMRP